MRTERRRGHAERHAERAERRARKREGLLEAAIKVVRREGPAVSMDAIAKEAGVTKPIIYKAFGDREGLTAALADRFSAELSQRIAGALAKACDDRERVSATIDAYLGFIEEDPKIVRFLVHRGLAEIESSGIATSGFVRHLAELVTQALGEAMRKDKVDSGAAEPWAYAIVGAVHLAGDWWLERRTLPRERLVEYLTALAWDGMDNYAKEAT